VLLLVILVVFGGLELPEWQAGEFELVRDGFRVQPHRCGNVIGAPPLAAARQTAQLGRVRVKALLDERVGIQTYMIWCSSPARCRKHDPADDGYSQAGPDTWTLTGQNGPRSPVKAWWCGVGFVLVPADRGDEYAAFRQMCATLK
jgi:hypothetical protein